MNGIGNIFQTLKAFIASHPRDEWEHYYHEKYTNLRIWTQEHGEKALAIGIVVGIVFTLFYRIVLLLGVSAFVVMYCLWYFAPKTRNSDQPSQDQP